MLTQRFSSRPARLAAAALTLALVAACSSSTTDSTASGQTNWNATATGGISGSFSGFSAQNVAAGYYSIGLASTDQSFDLALQRVGSRAATGTYSVTQLGSSTAFLAALTYKNGTAVSVFGGTSGSITITSSSATEADGTFDITMATGDGKTTTHITGSFKAPCGVGC